MVCERGTFRAFMHVRSAVSPQVCYFEQKRAAFLCAFAVTLHAEGVD